MTDPTTDGDAEMKEQEFRQVCALFGCTDARILPFKDKPFKKSDEAVEAVRNIIYETRPNVLITTPGRLELAAILGGMVSAGTGVAVLETSSHALHQRRTADLAFEVAIFTIRLVGFHQSDNIN